MLDNGSSHVAKVTQQWLVEHPRFVAHYTPKHSSWLNQVELWFSKLYPQAPPSRGVRLARGADRAGHGLHPRLQPFRQTIPLDIRRVTPLEAA